MSDRTANLTESFDLYVTASDATLRGWTLAAGTPTIETTVVKDGRPRGW